MCIHFDLFMFLILQLLVDKDTIVNAVTSSHEVHLQKIDNREDQIVSRIRQWLKALIKNIHEEEEVQRNRQRVIEINNLIDHFKDEVENFDAMLGTWLPPLQISQINWSCLP